jgi:hypothetical protein
MQGHPCTRAQWSTTTTWHRTPDVSTEGANAPSLLPSQHLTPTLHALMPTPYELMDLYRTWWRSSYSTTPNSQATIIAAAWAEHVLATYPATFTPPTGKVIG